MIAEHSYGAHSAQVEMQLIVKGESISITQMGSDFLFVESPTDHAAGEATIVLTVDGRERRWMARLPEGICKASKRVALALCEYAATAKCI